MKTKEFAPLSWRQVGLAVVPGLVAFLLRSHAMEILGLSAQRGGSVYNSLAAASALLIIVGLLWERKSMPWMFPAVGTFLTTFPGLVFDLLFPPSGPRPLIFDVLVNLWLFAAWGVSAVIVWRYYRGITISKGGWVLLGAVIMVGLSQGGALTLPFVMGLIVLPIAVGLMFAQRHGLLAGLVPVAGLYWLVDSVFDPSYFVPPRYATVIEMVLALSFLVVPPIWVLRSRSLSVRLGGLILPPGLVLIGSEVMRSVVYPPKYSAEMWLTRGLGVGQIILAIGFATVVYQSVGRRADSGGLVPLILQVLAIWHNYW